MRVRRGVPVVFAATLNDDDDDPAFLRFDGAGGRVPVLFAAATHEENHDDDGDGVPELVDGSDGESDHSSVLALDDGVDDSDDDGVDGVVAETDLSATCYVSDDDYEADTAPGTLIPAASTSVAATPFNMPALTLEVHRRGFAHIHAPPRRDFVHRHATSYHVDNLPFLD